MDGNKTDTLKAAMADSKITAKGKIDTGYKR